MEKKRRGLYQIVKERSIPGTLVFDLDCNLLYANREALKMVPEFQTTSERKSGQRVCNKILNLCKQLNQRGKKRRHVSETNLACGVLNRGSEDKYSMQAFFMGSFGDKKPSHIILLIQKLIEKHKIDIIKTQLEFSLSPREMEVLRLICDGFANKEISKKLFISDHTVKGHMKSIFKKMRVNSRIQVINSLK